MKIVGDGTRALNFFIDTLLVFLLAFICIRIWDWYVVYWGYTHYKFGWFFFSIQFIYYFFFETLFARTPGKWLSYSKLVNLEGKKPGIFWVFIRSITRIIFIDMFFIPLLGKPLHDYTSKTTVIQA